jgi:hypothetical protein
LIDGKVGGAYRFSGSPNQISFSTSGLPYGDSFRTTCLWARINDLSLGTTYRWAFAYGNTRWGENWFIGTSGTAGSLRFGSWGGGHTKSVAGVFEEGVWSHICTSYNGLTIVAYVDGEKVFEENDDGLDTQESTAYIGRQGPWYAEHWVGDVDEVAIWDRVLSEEEVKAIYNDGAGINLFEVSKGLISDTIGDTPFYTNQTNPRTINLNAGQSQLVTAWVNATGEFGDYIFFEFANLTSNMSISSMTSEYSLSIL